MIRQIQEANEKVNANAELHKALKKLIPNAIGKDGSIDVDTIRYWAQKAVGDKSLVTEERETFNFLGKDYARLLYSLDTETVIIPDNENNKKVENKNSENLYLSGDNLEVLKHLRRSYEGQVKCIYIDPPYNTGSDDFVYNDSFDFTEKDIEEKLGFNTDSESAKRIHKMISRKSSRSHAAWLTFMYPRLKLARDLMKDDGVIFISIDDNEQANLKILCDEIFGEENFCGNLIIETATDNNPSQINTEHEYMLCYAKDIMKQGKWKRKSIAAQKIIDQYEILKNKYSNIEKIQEELRSWIKKHKDELPQVSHYNNVDEKGVFSSSSNSSNTKPGDYNYDILHPTTKKPCPKPTNGWRWPKETFNDYEKKGEVVWGEDESTQPHIKKRIETASDLLKSVIYEDTRASSQMVKDLFNGIEVFSNSKPENLISRIIDFTLKKNDLVLDFFSGSGTTAHSILNMNSNKDFGKNVQFIAVQLNVALDEQKQNSVTKNAIKFLDSINKPHTLDQIGMERIRRAAKKIKEENPDYEGDLGFKHFTIQKTTQKSIDKIIKFDINTNIGDASVLKEFGTETVLATWMVNDGHTFNAQVETIDLKGYKAFRINDYLYLIDEGISNESIKSLFQKYDEENNFKPKHIVAFGYSFGMTMLETLKANIKGISDINIQLEVRY
ncbi:adenine-specific DNA-methyltransferase [Fibrobacter sp. UWT2]|uniref:site-specific DNA-methyltransferase n=1 Tax=Fibrobacter sp. UWT2 TaxID=1896224 RepID=UPI00091CBA94|nr:site-specific DNA-methyltransferase [Fibrobacter sp. UWT2]SHL15005.1 adenine-specific DNA-methyltransferase [Fibrobacter sp. UWT2]